MSFGLPVNFPIVLIQLIACQLSWNCKLMKELREHLHAHSIELCRISVIPSHILLIFFPLIANIND